MIAMCIAVIPKYRRFKYRFGSEGKGPSRFWQQLNLFGSGKLVNWIISDFVVRIFLTARRVVRYEVRVTGCEVRVAGFE
jgi:hypothetical protein